MKNPLTKEKRKRRIIIRSPNINEDIIKEYILDDFNNNDNNIIVSEIEKRLFGYDKKDLEIGSGNGKYGLCNRAWKKSFGGLF